MDTVKRLWRGELPLATTYWVFGVLISGIGVRLGWVAIERNSFFLARTGYVAVVIYSFVLVSTLYGLLISVATWRSANNYTGPRHWRILAKAGVVLGLILTAAVVGEALRSDDFKPDTMSDTAEMLNKSLPTMVDSITELSRVSAQDQTLTYHFRIVGKRADEIDMQAVSAQVKKHACTLKDIRDMVTRGITVIYAYSAADKTGLGQVVVTRRECGM